jgi:type IX secretion system PorP/SprF family membrane protein
MFFRVYLFFSPSGKMRKLLVCLYIFGFMSGMVLNNEVEAQDPQFTQFYANPLYLNPAFAGSARCPRICMNFRDEWPAIPGTFVTYSGSYDQHVDALAGGVGLIITQDEAGQATLTTTSISAVYAYQLNISRTFTISAGFEGGYQQKTIDESKLNFGDMIDPRKGFIYNTSEVLYRNTVGVPDFSAGAMGYSKNLFLGFSVDHLTQPDQSFVAGASPLPIKLTIHAGAMIGLNTHSLQSDEVTISPNIFISTTTKFPAARPGILCYKRLHSRWLVV